MLDFGRIPLGLSATRPLVVTASGREPVELGIVVPPLAPFSLAPATGRDRSSAGGRDGRGELWVRYDATRSMARDRGELVVGVAGTGIRWTVELRGQEALAGR